VASPSPALRPGEHAAIAPTTIELERGADPKTNIRPASVQGGNISSENTLCLDWRSDVCRSVAGCCLGVGARGTDRNPQFSESPDMMPDHPLFLPLIENGRPRVLAGSAGEESLIDENQ